MYRITLSVVFVAISGFYVQTITRVPFGIGIAVVSSEGIGRLIKKKCCDILTLSLTRLNKKEVEEEGENARGTAVFNGRLKLCSPNNRIGSILSWEWKIVFNNFNLSYIDSGQSIVNMISFKSKKLFYGKL